MRATKSMWWLKMKKNIKTEICNEFIKSGLAAPCVVINHSYTDGGGEIWKTLLKVKIIFVLA